MRYRNYFLLCFLLGGIAAAHGQFFKPLTSLRVIQTKYFDIIYPPESESTARTVAGFADQTYERVSGLLGITLQHRLPVAINPHSDVFNGSTAFMPAIAVMLFDTPMDAEGWAAANTLEGLFVHELVHAVSMSTMGPAARVFYKIFGGWTLPAVYTAPKFMIEGAAVSFESLDGTGRVNDPLIRQRLLQDIYEDAFHGPFQASGVYDLPPGGNIFYNYGGFFSAYLQNKYGMEKYAGLWQAMGQEGRTSFVFTNHLYYRSFTQVYGVPFMDAWKDFQASLRSGGAVEAIEENAQRRYSGFGLHKKLLIGGTASGGGRVFFIDELEGNALVHDPETGSTRTALSLDRTAYALDASADGGRLLVSSYRYEGALPRAAVTEYAVKSGLPTGRVWGGLYKGRYFREGVIGLGKDLHRNSIVYRSPEGAEETLLRGSAEIVYSNPAALDGEWIVFTAAKRGRRELCLFRYGTNELYTLVSDLEDDDERWRFIRGLTVSEGRILFSFDHDNRMYKLGLVDMRSRSGGGALPEGAAAVFTERNFSGGVFQPVIAGNRVYYEGAFRTWDALMQYPEAADALSGVKASLRLEPWDGADAALALGAAPAMPADAMAAGPLPDSKGYIPFTYMNPFRFWIPLVPLFRASKDADSFDGLGIFSWMTDPAQTNEIQTEVFGDWKFKMAPFSLIWVNRSFGFPLQFQASDNIDPLPANGPWRITAFSLSGRVRAGLGGERLVFSAAPDVTVQLNAQDTKTGETAYSWQYGDPVYSIGVNAELSTLERWSWELFGRGAALSVSGRSALPFSAFRTEGLFRFALEPVFPLRAALYGVWDSSGMDIHGTSRYFGSRLFASYASTEYTDTDIQNLAWLTGAEAEIKLFSAEIQRGVSHLYINRFFGSLAWRGAFFDDRGDRLAEGTMLSGTSYRLLNSLFLRLGLTASTAVIQALPYTASFSIIGGWKVSNMNDGKLNDFFVRPVFTLEL